MFLLVAFGYLVILYTRHNTRKKNDYFESVEVDAEKTWNNLGIIPTVLSDQIFPPSKQNGSLVNNKSVWLQ